MTNPNPNDECARMREDLGPEKWEALGHFLSEGDYLGLNRSDYRGAIAQYEKAWELLGTRRLQQIWGADILGGIADFASRSGDPDLATDILDSVMLCAAQISDASLRKACDQLELLANQTDQV